MLLHYHAAFLPAAESNRLLDRLVSEVEWCQEELQLYGRRVPVPRLLAWCGDAGVNYRYSGRDHVCRGWFEPLQAIRDRLREELGLACNLVLLNRYRNGSDYMGWHRDDERGHGAEVASLSLGGARRLLVRLPGGRASTRLDLENGSLLLMDGRLPHSLPPTRRAVAERINLTFRCIGGAAR